MSEKDFGDFEEIIEPSQEGAGNQGDGENSENISSRIRNPRGRELIGVILQRLGGNRMDIKSTDGIIRNCKVPGRYKRRLWLRPKDIVLIIPDEFNDKKGEIVYKYKPAELTQLRKKGIIDSLKEEF